MKTGRKPTYLCDENFFEKIDTPEKAYFLGFIMADGSISGGSSLVLGLSEKDRVLLEEFCQHLKCNIPLKNDKKRNAVILSITRKKVVKDLIALGLKENKSLNNLSWVSLEDFLMRHLIRGFFDGDGSIWNKGLLSWAIGFAGGYDFLSNLKTYLESLGVKCGQIRFRFSKENKNSCILDISHRENVKKFYDLFYSDGCVCLQRKLDKFKIFINDQAKIDSLDYSKNGNKEKIVNLYKEGLSQKEISLNLNLPYSSVRGTVQRARKSNLC